MTLLSGSSGLVARQNRVDRHRRKKSAMSVTLRVRALARALHTGEFINSMWGGEGSWLALLQMTLIRCLFIWPLKAVAPAAYCFWTRRLVRRLLQPQNRVRKTPVGIAATLKAIVWWSAKESLSLWMALEALFLLFYVYKSRRLQKRASPPMMRPGQPLQVLRQTLAATNDIQAYGRMLEPSRSSDLLTPDLTPKANKEEFQQALHPKRNESNVEQLLREWEAMQQQGTMNEVSSRLSEHDRVVMDKLMDDAEMTALKRAEISGWFLRKDVNSPERWPAARVGEICRGNIAEWLAWGFLHCEPSEVPYPRRAEFEELIDECIGWAELRMRDGYNPAAKAMRLTMDPIPSEHRPLIYYIVTALAFPILTDRHYGGLGFKKYHTGTLSYWYRPGNNVEGSGPPLVFCHGVGINLLPYAPFINQMLQSAPDRSIFLVSLPHISMRIKEDVPSSAEMVACLSDMLATWGASSAHFIGHSFGSLLVAWMAKRAPELMSMATFIDPVCFLLVKPDVCYNFMYKKPTTPTQLLTHYFVARELYIAHSLSRNFFWFQNLLWPEEVSMPALVVLAGHDSIVPAHSVRRYLMAHKQRHKKDNMKVLWFPDLGHGEINFGPVGVDACKRIVDEMLLTETACKVAHRPV